MRIRAEGDLTARIVDDIEYSGIGIRSLAPAAADRTRIDLKELTKLHIFVDRFLDLLY